MVVKIKALWPAVVWSLFILALSISPSISLPPSWSDLIGWDKIGHLSFYAVEAFLWCWGIHRIHPAQASYGFWISILYGILIECIQFAFFPSRYFEVLDIIANIIGTIIGWYFFRRIIK